MSTSRKLTGGATVKQAADAFTLDMLDKPRRGRPRKPDAKTDAQRAREYRARQRAKRRDMKRAERGAVCSAAAAAAAEAWPYPVEVWSRKP